MGAGSNSLTDFFYWIVDLTISRFYGLFYCIEPFKFVLMLIYI